MRQLDPYMSVRKVRNYWKVTTAARVPWRPLWQLGQTGETAEVALANTEAFLRGLGVSVPLTVWPEVWYHYTWDTKSQRWMRRFWWETK